MRNPWDEWEVWWRNLYPHNPTQTNYLRFRETRFGVPENDFDKSMAKIQSDMRNVFRTPYLDILEDYYGNRRL